MRNERSACNAYQDSIRHAYEVSRGPMSDCEIAQYYVCKERVARKEHECCECSAPIEIGEKYLQVNACWEGRPSVERQHVLCEQACEFVRDSGINDDECLYYGGLKDWYREWVKGGYTHEAELSERQKIWGFMVRIARRERLTKNMVLAK